MNIVILGLGYLGCTVTASAIADGHRVIGVDRDRRRWTSINDGVSPVHEPDLSQFLRAGVTSGSLNGQPALGETLSDADMLMICVDTPGEPSGELDLTDIVAVTKTVGTAVRSRPGRLPPLVLAYRSTLPVGTMERSVLPTLAEASGEAPGTRYEACYNPEFLREGSALADNRAPSRIILGERHPGATRRLLGFYSKPEIPVFELSFEAAELAKLVDNGFHALKVAFINEVGRYAACLGLDAQQIADVFLADSRLNTSHAYLRPGGPFGGSCLAKDVAALSRGMADIGIAGPVLWAVNVSNRDHHAYVLAAILDALPAQSRILIFGVGFKASAADVRNSPAVGLAVDLTRAGHRVSICDPDIEESQVELPAELAGAWVTAEGQTGAKVDLVVAWKSSGRSFGAARVYDVHRLQFRT